MIDAAATRPKPLGGTVDLHYVARAGLLPELSRQTYDSLWKAIREAVLNAVDANAERIEIDFSEIASTGSLCVIDDGVGMTITEFCEQFMSLGGSAKFGDAERFGRIGIGSLALLQYGQAALVETKRADAGTMTRAHISHSWDLDRAARHEHLGDLSAGNAQEVAYDGDPRDHFTRVRILGVSPDVANVGSDPSAFYALLERLRRVLPLPWANGPLTDALRDRSPDLVKILEAHTAEWSAPITVHSPWERDIVLTRRGFGDDAATGETWSGPPVPILKTVRVPGGDKRRRVTVAGYLLNQTHATSSWMGLTARVQNVAVEEHTFFDVTADPGFRKYISGEIWILGDIDRERLINIDRASFNRECPDYQVVQRYLSRAIVDFKSSSVQRPQRAKVAVRRRIEQHLQTLTALQDVVARVAGTLDAGSAGLPASEASRSAPADARSLIDELQDLGAEVVVTSTRGGRGLYDLEITETGDAVRVLLDPTLERPTVDVAGAHYELAFSRAGVDAPPVIIRNRPRRIIINLEHPSHSEGSGATKLPVGFALEVAYLLDGHRSSEALYERLLDLLRAC